MGNSNSITGSLDGDIKHATQDYLPKDLYNIISEFNEPCEYVENIEKICRTAKGLDSDIVTDIFDPFDYSKRINCKKYCLEVLKRSFDELLKKEYFAPQNLANASSNSSIYLPFDEIQVESMQSLTYFFSFPISIGAETGMNRFCIRRFPPFSYEVFPSNPSLTRIHLHPLMIGGRFVCTKRGKLSLSAPS